MFKNVFWFFIFTVMFLAISYYLSKDNNSFPRLENTDYAGRAFIYKKSYPLIVRGGKILALVKKNEKPQLISNSLSNSSNHKTEIIINGSKHLLTGEKKKERYLGYIKLNKEKIGTWYLEKSKLKEISNKELEKLDRDEIDKNIKLAKNHYLTKDTILNLKNSLEILKDKNKLLMTGFKNKDTLKNKIKNSDTKKELSKLKEDNKTSIKQIEKRKFQLTQVNRISKKGRLLEFNKRTAKRENTWYLNNWTGFNNYEHELKAAKKLGISRAELRRKLKVAQDFLSIKNEIRKEKELIANLNNSQYQYEKTISISETTNDITNKIEQAQPFQAENTRKKKKSLWKKIGDVFR